jgi:soluble lytic murein transglycosylase-like protein
VSWPPKIEALRQYVVWECRDIPPDLVLAIIKHESGGNAGIAAKVRCKCGQLPDVNGNMVELCNALGLMQVIPGTVDWYNESVPDAEKATVEDMTGTDERAIRLQIRTGCKFLAHVNNYLHNRFPETLPESSLSTASDDQIKLVLAGYAVGNGAVEKKMNQAKEEGYSPTFANLKRLFPKWGQNSEGKWINRPLTYAADTITNYKANRSGSFTGTRPGDILARLKTGNKGGLLALAVCLTAAGWAVNRYYKPKD